jgi:hypothetical protein
MMNVQVPGAARRSGPATGLSGAVTETRAAAQHPLALWLATLHLCGTRAANTPRLPEPHMSYVRFAVVTIACMLTACSQPEESVIGSWTAVDPEARWTVTIAGDSTWTMQANTLNGEGTYTSAAEEGMIELHPTGRIAEVMPQGFRAHLDADTLRLCSVVGCTDMVRVDSR